MLSVAMSYDIDQITHEMEIIRVSTKFLVSHGCGGNIIITVHRLNHLKKVASESLNSTASITFKF